MRSVGLVVKVFAPVTTTDKFVNIDEATLDISFVTSSLGMIIKCVFVLGRGYLSNLLTCLLPCGLLGEGDPSQCKCILTPVSRSA